MTKCADCNRYAVFGTIKPTHCKLHKSGTMVDVKNKRCLHKRCTKRASFGLIYGKPTCCKSHVMPGMVDVVSRQCVHPSCNTHPKFGYKKALYCRQHAEDDMVDLISKRCDVKGCDTISTFGYVKNRPIKCSLHKEFDMRDVRS